MVNGYTITSDPTRFDLEIILGFLNRSYWAAGIPRETLQRAIDNSLCFGLFTEAGAQVGFARMISDYATFAYMSDVYVAEEHRGRGLSKWLVATMMQHPKLQGLRRMVLATKDAHSLYQQFGFTALSAPTNFMEVWRPDIYQTQPLTSQP